MEGQQAEQPDQACPGSGALFRQRCYVWPRWGHALNVIIRGQECSSLLRPFCRLWHGHWRQAFGGQQDWHGQPLAGFTTLGLKLPGDHVLPLSMQGHSFV